MGFAGFRSPARKQMLLIRLKDKLDILNQYSEVLNKLREKTTNTYIPIMSQISALKIEIDSIERFIINPSASFLVAALEDWQKSKQ